MTDSANLACGINVNMDSTKVLKCIDDLKEHFQGEFDILKETTRSFQAKFVEYDGWMNQKGEHDRIRDKQDERRDKLIETLQFEIKDLKDSKRDMKEHILKVEGQSRRDNLVFEGVKEHRGETNFDCYCKVTDIMNRMGVPGPHNIRITRAHRLGKYNANINKPRPIITKFHWYGDKVPV